MAETAVRRNIDRKSSIENEPRTLSYHQLECARDAALYVVSTRSIEEAMRIFTQGLEPVACVGKRNSNSVADVEEEGYGLEDELRGFRDIVTAPF